MSARYLHLANHSKSPKRCASLNFVWGRNTLTSSCNSISHISTFPLESIVLWCVTEAYGHCLSLHVKLKINGIAGGGFWWSWLLELPHTEQSSDLQAFSLRPAFLCVYCSGQMLPVEPQPHIPRWWPHWACCSPSVLNPTHFGPINTSRNCDRSRMSKMPSAVEHMVEDLQDRNSSFISCFHT